MNMGRRVDDMRAMIKLCHAGSIRIFEGLNDEDSLYAPAVGMMSLAGHLHHLAFVERHFLRTIVGALKINLEIPDIERRNTVSAEIDILKETWELTDKLLDRLDDNDLDHSIPIDEPEAEMDARYLLHALAEHNVHHRGEMVVYFRIMGRRPPRRYRDDAPE